MLAGFIAFVVAREYIVVDDAFVDLRPPPGGFPYMCCGDCFGPGVSMTGFAAFAVTREYIAVEDDGVDVFLDVRSPSGAIVHDNSLEYDTHTNTLVLLHRFVSAVCFGFGVF